MFLSRFLDRVKSKELSNIFIQLFLIIVGVLAAFAVENYRQSILEKKTEKEYLIAFRNAVEADTMMLNQDIQRCFQKKRAAKIFLELIENERALDSNEFEGLIEAVMMNIAPFYYTAIYEDLKASGRLQIISNEALRNAIIEYYITIEHLREVQDRMSIEISYHPAFTEVLTFSEYALEGELNQHAIVSRLRAKEESRRYLLRLQKGAFTFYGSLLFNGLPKSQNLLDDINQELESR